MDIGTTLEEVEVKINSWQLIVFFETLIQFELFFQYVFIKSLIATDIL